MAAIDLARVPRASPVPQTTPVSRTSATACSAKTSPGCDVDLKSFVSEVALLLGHEESGGWCWAQSSINVTGVAAASATVDVQPPAGRQDRTL
jgi:hypothetical protein